MRLTKPELDALIAKGVVFPRHPKYAVESLHSGLSVYRGVGPQPPFVRFVALVAQLCPLHCVVDFKQLGQPVPAQLLKPQYLFDFLPAEAQASSSPLLISSADPIDIPELATSSLGKDAVVWVFSRLDQSELIAHVRKNSASFARPSILEPQLALTPGEFVSELMGGIDAIVLESKTSPWVAYSGPGFTQPLQELGFVQESGNAG